MSKTTVSVAKVAKKKVDPTAVVAGDEPADMVEPRLIPMKDIVVDEDFNSRDKVDLESQEFVDLRECIRSDGLIEAVRVSPREDGGYELIAGFRRYFACMQLGHLTIAATVKKYTSHAEALTANIIENMQRVNLRPYEQAMAFDRLRKDGWTPKDIAVRVRKSDGHVGNLLRCVDNLPKDIMSQFRVNPHVPSGEFVRIAGMTNPDKTPDHGRMREAWVILTGGRASKSEADKESDEDKKEKAKFKRVSAEALDRCAAEIKNAESVIILGKTQDISEEMRDFGIALMRWARGRIKRYPLVIVEEE